MTRRRREVSAAEVALWRASMKDVTPLPGRVEGDEPPEPPPAPSPPLIDPAPRSVEPPPAPRPRQPPSPLAHGTAANVDKRTAERFKRGRMDIDARLDLHGHTQDLAHAALRAFIASAFERGHRCVLVITGKGWREGTGVIRANVPRWLNEAGMRERVLSFSYAQPQHGGEGALYVLLKRKR